MREKKIDNPVGVVSAAIFRDQTMSEVLLGVRKETPLVNRHPGVLSTLTVGVPVEIFDVLSLDKPVPYRDGDIIGIKHDQVFTVGQAGYLDDTRAFVLEALLARKAGISDALTLGRFVGRGQLKAISVDLVADPLGTEQEERTRMLTYSIVVERGADEFPDSTPSYSRFIWVNAARVGEAMEKRDALLLDSTLNPFEVCIDGLCIRSAIATLPG